MNDSEADIVFLALARNCAQYLPAFFTFLERLSSEGVTVAAVVGENGSTDGTRDLLHSAQQRLPSLSYIDTSFIEQIPRELRTRRLGEAREFLAKYASARFRNARFICVVDVDNVLLKMPPTDVFLSSADRLSKRNDIFGVSAMSFPYYYDLAALRCRGFFDENVLPLIAKEKRNLRNYYSFMQDNIYQTQRNFTLSNFRLCESAFNGLCIYRPSDYFLGTYVDNSAPDVCEHVILNERIHAATGRKIFVDDSLVVSMPQEHGPQSFAYFAGSRAFKLARQGFQRIWR